jgi:predicted DCC family thiol-disulfide oxidoreductase YuxK
MQDSRHPEPGRRPESKDMERERTDPPIILFDGVCVLCSGFAQFVIRRDPRARFRFAAMQSEPGRALLRRYGLPLENWDSNALIEDGVAYLKSAAVFRILRHLSGAWPLLALGRFVLPRRLCDGLYDRVARNRYGLFGRRETCLVPTAELRRRFLA